MESEADAFKLDIQQRITDRAYQLFDASGRREGNDQANWCQAESEVLQRGIDVREVGSWLALCATVPSVSAEDVQIYLEPSRVIVRAKVTKGPDGQQHGMDAWVSTQAAVFLTTDLAVEVEPVTAIASLKNNQLTVSVKKRRP